MCSLLAGRTELETAGDSEAFGGTRSNESNIPSRSQYDLVTRIHANSHWRNQFHRATTMEDLTTKDHKEHKNDDDEPNIKQLKNAVTNVPTLLWRNTQKHKLLQNQGPTFKGQKERYNEFEHLVLNHIRPFQKKLTEAEKPQFFSKILQEDAIQFWQTI